MALICHILTFLIVNHVFVDISYLASGFGINLLQLNETLTKNKKHENKTWNFNIEFANGMFIYHSKRDWEYAS